MTVMSYGDQVNYDHRQASETINYGLGGTFDRHEELKEKLLRKYSGYITTLKTELLKKRKKVELPKPARTTLLRWWNSHSRWPYPSVSLYIYSTYIYTQLYQHIVINSMHGLIVGRGKSEVIRGKWVGPKADK